MIKGYMQIYLIIKCKKFINLIWYMLTTWVSEKKNLGNLSSLHHRGALMVLVKQPLKATIYR